MTSPALDVQAEAELWGRLFSRKGSVTALMVSHRPAALTQADQVLLLEEGTVADMGTLPELLARSPQMRSLWHQEQSRS